MLIYGNQELKQCLLGAYELYGTYRTCTRSYLSQVSAIITCCQFHIPTFPGPFALTTTKRKVIQKILIEHFAELPTEFDDGFYKKYVSRLKALLILAKELTSLPHLQDEVTLSMEMHDMLPPSSAITTSFHNLCTLQDEVNKLKNSTEAIFFCILDSCPYRAEVQLRSLMKEVRTIT